MLSLLPREATYYWCSPNIARALPAEELQVKASSFGLVGNHYESVEDAINAAKQTSAKSDVIFIGGSNFVVAEIEEL